MAEKNSRIGNPVLSENQSDSRFGKDLEISIFIYKIE